MTLHVNIKNIYLFLIWFFVACSALPDKPSESEFDNPCDPNINPPVSQFPFYIYKDMGSSENHYTLMHVAHNHFTNILIDTASTALPLSGSTTCVEVTWPKTFIAEDTSAHWYWLTPKGYNLSKAKRFTFKARGKLGGEKVGFLIGGLANPEREFRDTVYDNDWVPFQTYPLVLNQAWTPYAIEADLLTPSLCRVVGGFSFQLKRSFNQSAITFYIDEIRYE